MSDYRRKTDDVIFEMAQDVAAIKATIPPLLEMKKDHENRLRVIEKDCDNCREKDKTIDDHEARLRGIEKARTVTAIRSTAVAGGGGFLGGLVGYFSDMAGIFR